MLTQSLSLSLIAFLLALMPLWAVLGDPWLSARWATAAASGALIFALYGHVRVMLAHVKREETPLAFRARAPILEQPQPAPGQQQAIEPAPKPEKTTEIRLIPVNHYNPGLASNSVFASDMRPLKSQPNQMIDGVDVRDLRYFIELLPAKGGHQRRRWLGTTLPSGRKIDADYYELLVAPLVKCKAIEGRAPRVAGTLTVSPQTIKERLGLAP